MFVSSAHQMPTSGSVIALLEVMAYQCVNTMRIGGPQVYIDVVDERFQYGEPMTGRTSSEV